MNRYAPAFRIAVYSLIFAIGLPLLVFVAAQVRHRQLQSKANPRWAAFATVNGSQPEPTAKPVIRHATQTKSLTFTDPTAQLANQPNGFTGSATDDMRMERFPATDARSVKSPSEPNRAIEQPRPLFGSTPSLPASSDSHVSKPTRHENPEFAGERTRERDTENHRIATQRPDVPLHARNDGEGMASPSQIESRLAGIQRRLDELTQRQVDKKDSEIDRISSLLEQLQVANQKPKPRTIASSDNDSFPSTPSQHVNRSRLESPGHRATSAASRARGTGTITNTPLGRDPSIKIIQGELGDEDERFSIQVQDANLLELLEMLAQLADVNILTSPKVQGRVTLQLRDVTVDQALVAIVKSQGFVYERDDSVIYVRTATEAAEIRQFHRKVSINVFRLPNIRADELETQQTTPASTSPVGHATVTSLTTTETAKSPTTERESGRLPRDERSSDDDSEVVEQANTVVPERDGPQSELLIEARILSVALPIANPSGVNFAMLKGDGELIKNTAGLKYGVLHGDASTFLRDVERHGITTVIGTPHLRLLDKQKSELTIGQRLSGQSITRNGPTPTDSTTIVNGGAKLLLQPFIQADGRIRIEIRPKLDPANINNSTEVLVCDGGTLVIGGLISAETRSTTDRETSLGTNPSVGQTSRNHSEATQRHELILLITPRIVTQPAAAAVGAQSRNAAH